MTAWKEARIAAGQSLQYDEFDKKKELNEDLRIEQYHICCYCQRSIDHYQGDKIGGAHNEHLIPEKGPYGDYEKQMDYGNIYACCIDSQGLRKKERDKRHCGEAKADKLIYPFIQMEDCESYFRYNVLGEIIPNGEYSRWEEYRLHKNELPEEQRRAFDAIETLNLNCHSLREDRREDLYRLLSILPRRSKEEIQRKIDEFLGGERYPRYISMLLYYMRMAL